MTSAVRRSGSLYPLIGLLFVARGVEFTATCVAADTDQFPAKTAAAIDRAVKSEMQKEQLVGVAIGVIQQGRIVYTQGYGFADRERATPVTRDTVFNWASNSKPLAAVAAMQLVEQGQLKLDEDVRHYVPEFPDKGRKITVRQLLCHQSGIPHYANGKIIPTNRQYSEPDPFMNPVLALDRFNKSPLLFHPGEKYSYSSYAYVLLSAVLQQAGKQPLIEQIEARIAKPLDMKSLQLDVGTQLKDHWATGYKKNDQGKVVSTPPEAAYWKQGAGGFKSNVDDFARFAAGLINRSLVSAEMEAQMWQPQSTSDSKPTECGLGFFIAEQGGLKVSHSGEQTGVATRLVIYPRGKSGVVVMCNCGFANPGKISTAIYSELNRK